jgi:hypothetical protein
MQTEAVENSGGLADTTQCSRNEVEQIVLADGWILAWVKASNIEIPTRHEIMLRAQTPTSRWAWRCER